MKKKHFCVVPHEKSTALIKEHMIKLKELIDSGDIPLGVFERRMEELENYSLVCKTYPVNIDYSRTPEEVILSDGTLHSEDGVIEQIRYFERKDEEKEVIIHLAPKPQGKCIVDFLYELRYEYNPASYIEGLNLGLRYPDIQSDCTIIIPDNMNGNLQGEYMLRLDNYPQRRCVSVVEPLYTPRNKENIFIALTCNNPMNL